QEHDAVPFAMSIWGMRLAIAVCGAAVAAAPVWCERDLAADDRLDAGFGTGSGKFESAKQIAAVGDRDGRHRLAAAQLHQFLGFDRPGGQRISAVHTEMDKIGERHGVSMKSWPDLKMAWRKSEYTLLSPGLEDAAAAHFQSHKKDKLLLGERLEVAVERQRHRETPEAIGLPSQNDVLRLRLHRGRHALRDLEGEEMDIGPAGLAIGVGIGFRRADIFPERVRELLRSGKRVAGIVAIGFLRGAIGDPQVVEDAHQDAPGGTPPPL